MDRGVAWGVGKCVEMPGRVWGEEEISLKGVGKLAMLFGKQRDWGLHEGDLSVVEQLLLMLSMTHPHCEMVCIVASGVLVLERLACLRVAVVAGILSWWRSGENAGW